MASSALQRKLKLVPENEEGVSERTLVIGDLSRWASEGRETSSFDAFHFTSFGLLTKELLEQLRPNIILSQLVADEFDVIEVACNLSKLGFQGRYRAITNEFLHADMIRKEVRNHAPDLDFDILVMRTAANNG